jgi:hypothetical protein
LTALRSVLARTSSRHAAGRHEAIHPRPELVLRDDVLVYPHAEVNPPVCDFATLRPFLRRLAQPWSDR